jgi:hypothetical protein
MNRRSAIASFIAAVALGGCLAPVAQATYDPVASGATKLTLDKSFLALLKENGVRVAATASARLKAGTVTFPVSGGKFDPAAGRGTAEHEGSLLFQAGARRVPVRSWLLRTSQRHAPFSVKVGGGQLKLAEAPRVVVSRRGFGSAVRVRLLRLSAKVATRLDKKLRLRGVFEAGQPLGSSITEVNPLTVALKGRGRVGLDLAPSFVAKLQSLFVAVNPIFPAEHPGPFTLPIFGGAVSTDAVVGQLATSGALEFLQLGGGQVFWREPSLDFGAQSLDAEAEVDPSPPYGGKLGSVSIAALSPGSSSADPQARTVSISSAGLALDAQMASLFNEAFAKPLGKEDIFLAGETVGALNFTAKGE